MPAVEILPSNTELPGLVRRRVWSYPELTSHSVAVLTLRRLHLAPLAGEPKQTVLAAIDKGMDLEKLLGPLTTVVDLTSVRGVKLDLLTNSLTIEYDAAGHAAIRVTLAFSTADAADKFFSKLWRRLGEEYKLLPYKRGVWDLARAPLLLLVGVLVATAAVVFGASVADDLAAARAAQGGAVSVVESAFGWVNWKVACGLGGALAAVSQVWMYRRMTQPPVRLQLARG